MIIKLSVVGVLCLIAGFELGVSWCENRASKELDESDVITRSENYIINDLRTRLAHEEAINNIRSEFISYFDKKVLSYLEIQLDKGIEYRSEVGP